MPDYDKLTLITALAINIHLQIEALPVKRPRPSSGVTNLETDSKVLAKVVLHVAPGLGAAQESVLKDDVHRAISMDESHDIIGAAKIGADVHSSSPASSSTTSSTTTAVVRIIGRECVARHHSPYSRNGFGNTSRRRRQRNDFGGVWSLDPALGVPYGILEPVEITQAHRLLTVDAHSVSRVVNDSFRFAENPMHSITLEHAPVCDRMSGSFIGEAV